MGAVHVFFNDFSHKFYGLALDLGAECSLNSVQFIFEGLILWLKNTFEQVFKHRRLFLLLLLLKPRQYQISIIYFVKVTVILFVIFIKDRKCIVEVNYFVSVLSALSVIESDHISQL